MPESVTRGCDCTDPGCVDYDAAGSAVAAPLPTPAVSQSREEFACPRCGTRKWNADLFLPGGIKVTCVRCKWSELVEVIERRMIDGEL